MINGIKEMHTLDVRELLLAKNYKNPRKCGL